MRTSPGTIRRLGPAGLVALLLAVAAPVHDPAQPADPVTDARRALDAGQVDQAIAIVEKAVADDAKDPAALAWLGSAQVRKARGASIFEAPGWVKKGFNTLDETVERFPQAFVVYVVRGITATQVPDLFRQTTEAPAAWDKGKALYPAAPEAAAMDKELGSL